MTPARISPSLLVTLLAFASAAALAQDANRIPTEDDYFASVPVVLTASRLDQPLNEAPGAITVIDRNTIRMSGSRTLAEVLRLVPGYLVGGYNGANPNAAYHIPLDDYGSRNLVLIDGRPVYSSILVGDTHRGMMDVMLEDIERIEVLRGANSAAYGANAMFGVINIITRHSADTTGADMALTKGSGQVWDRRVRVGGGDETAAFRLSAGEQRDNGYLNTHDDRRLSQAHLRTDFKPTIMDDVMVSGGISRLSAGDGFPDSAGNPLRTIYSRDTYFNAQWRHQLDSGDEWKMSANYMEDWTRDATPYPLLPAVILDFSGTGRRVNLEGQRKVTLSPTVRSVVGAGYKEESAYSPPLYSQEDWITFREKRVFGTVEWRFQPELLLNGGLFVGDHSRAGTYGAPRLMLNWLPSPEHTFRIGANESVRTPGISEYEGDVRYYLNGTLLKRTVAARGNVEPERLKSQEIGYLGRFTPSSLTVDLRLYRERMTSVISTAEYNAADGSKLTDYVNRDGLELRGVEGQLRWKPHHAIELWVNHSIEHLRWDDDRRNTELKAYPPSEATLLACFMHLPGDIEFTVMTQRTGAMYWRDYRDPIPTIRRTDVRVAKSFLLDQRRLELSYTVQGLEGATSTFLSSQNMQKGLRNFVQLKVEI